MTLQYDTNRDALRSLLAAFSGNGETMLSRQHVYRTIVEHMVRVLPIPDPLLTMEQKSAIRAAIDWIDPACSPIPRNDMLDDCDDCCTRAGDPCDVDCRRVAALKHLGNLRAMLRLAAPAAADPYVKLAAAVMEKRPEGAPSVIGASFGDLTGTPEPKEYDSAEEAIDAVLGAYQAPTWVATHRSGLGVALLRHLSRVRRPAATPATAESDPSWHTLFNDVAKALGCLPSAFSDCNAHVLKRASALSSDAGADYWQKQHAQRTEEADILRQRCEALEVYAGRLSQAPDKFKTFVHKRLDDVGVPHDPEPEHTAQHGCRISGRLNWLIERAKGVEDLAVSGLAFYYENQDCFLVHAKDVSTAVYESYELYVIHVLRNDPRHAKQYKAGYQFSCGISKTEPSVYKAWELKPVKRILVDKP